MKAFRAANKSKLIQWYYTYSVGGTIFLVLVAAIYDSGEFGIEEHRPNIGANKCFLHSNSFSRI